MQNTPICTQPVPGPLFSRKATIATACIAGYCSAALLVTSLMGLPSWASEKYGISAMCDGTAYRPFIRRTLIPSTVRLLYSTVPLSMKNSVNSWIDKKVYKLYSGKLDELLESKLAGARNRWSLFAFSSCFYVVILVGFFLCLRSAAGSIAKAKEPYKSLSPMLAIPFFIFFFNSPVQMYDFATVFLFTTGYILIYTSRTAALYFLLVIAAVNKETALLLVILNAWINRKIKPPRFIAFHAALQSMMCAAIFFSLEYFFRNNPGETQGFSLPHNIELLSHVSNYFAFMHLEPIAFKCINFGFYYPAGFNIPAIGLVAVILSFGWSRKPLFLRQSITILFPVLLVPALLFGSLWELRIFYEILPLIVLLLLPAQLRQRSWHA